MSIHEDKLPVDACKRLLRLRRTRSEEIERTSTSGKFHGSTAELDRLPARAQSLNLFLLLTNLEQPAISLRICDTNKLENDNCGCSATRSPRLADPVRARSSGSLSAASFNLLDDQVFTGRERGSRTSIANVKSREDLVMSDHGGASNSQLQPSNGNLTPGLKVAMNGGPKQTDKRAMKKRRPDKDKEKEKAQKDAASTGAKPAGQLDSPSAAKPKYKHAATSSQETANWPVWNTVRSSRTRLNESCSEQEELDGGEQPNVVDDASWQFMSMLSFRHGQRDDSKYRQLSAGESSASEADADTPAPTALPANRNTQSATRTDQIQVQTAFGAPSDSAERVQPTSTTLRTSESPSQRADNIRDQNWARWEFIEKTQRIVPSETTQSLTVEPRSECDAERPSPETNDPQQTAAAQERPRQPDTSSRPLLFDQDDSDTSNDCEPDPAADCADLSTALDEVDCAADCLLHEHSQNGVAEEDAISAAKLHYYATLSGTLDANANSNANNVRKQVLYGLDPRETSDDDQQRASAPPPPPPPRRTLPASSGTQLQREATGNVRPSQLENITDTRNTTGRSTPSDCVSTPSIGVALLPPPPSVPRRSSAGSKPSVAAARGTTKRQHWLARFDDDDDTSTQLNQPSLGPPSNAPPPVTTFCSTVLPKSTSGAVRFATTQPHDVPYDPNEEEEIDDAATYSDEQTRIMVAGGASRRSSTSVNANFNPLSDGTASLGRAAKKQHKRPTSGSTSSSRPESQLGNADAQRSSVVDGQSTSQLAAPNPTGPPRSETATAFANLSFVDCASDYDSRSPNGLAVAPAEQRKTNVDSATVRSSSAGNLNCPPPVSDKVMDDATTRSAARPTCKEQPASVRPDKADKEAPNNRRTHLLTFLRKPHLSNDSSSDSSDDSRNAIAKGDDTPDSPTAFQHRRFSSASPSCSSQDSDDKSHADAGAPNAKRPHAGVQQASGLLASLTSFTFPRGLRRAAAKKSAAQASAVTSDVCG